MPALPLTADQLADAKRLKSAFEEWKQERKSEGFPASQAEAAELLGMNQSGFSQYLNGKIPLNINMLMKCADLFAVAPRAISPTLAVTLEEIAGAVASGSRGEALTAKQNENLSPLAASLVAEVTRLDREGRHSNVLRSLLSLIDSLRMDEGREHITGND